MKRRDFLQGSMLAAGGLLVGTGTAAAGFKSFTKVDEGLFQGINRVENPKEKSLLEKKHAPVIELPETIKAGEPFTVTVTMGEVIHPMSAAHYIQYVELLAGNEPVGRMEFGPSLAVPKAAFTLHLKDPVTLVAREYCNLHGLWESRLDVAPS